MTSMSKKKKTQPKAGKPRVEPARLLHRDSTYVDSCPACDGLGCKKCDQTGALDPNEPAGYTSLTHKAMRSDPGEAPPREVVVQQTMEAKVRAVEQQGDEQVEWQAKVIANKVAKVQREASKLGVDLGPAFQRFIREQQAEIANRRKEAA